MNSKMMGKENKEPSYYELLKQEVKRKGKHKIDTNRSSSEVTLSRLFEESPMSVGPSRANKDVGRRLEAMLKLLSGPSSSTTKSEEVVDDHVNLEPNPSEVQIPNAIDEREPPRPAQELMENAAEEQLELECAHGQETQATPNVEGVTCSLEAISLLQPVKVEIDNHMDQSEENVALAEVTEEGEVVIPKDEVEEEEQAVSGGVQMEIEVGPVKFERLSGIIDEETKKIDPDFVRLSEAMIDTYEYHRKPLYDSCNVSVAKLKQLTEFTALKHYVMMKQEYCLIKNDLKKMEQLEGRLKKIFVAALEQAGKSASKSSQKGEYQWWTNALKLWKKKKQASDYQKLLGTVAVCIELVGHEGLNLLCKVLKNAPLMKKEIKLMANPTIVVWEADILKVGTKMWIYADKTEFLDVSNIYEAILSVYASYYVLNYEYPTPLLPLFEYFDMLSENTQDTYESTSAGVWPPVKIAISSSAQEFIKK